MAALVLLIVLLGVYPAGRQAWAFWHFQAAQSDLKRRDFAQAQAHLRRCLSIWNDSGETVFLAARTARRAGDLDAATRLLHRAEQLNWVPEAIALERALLRAQQGDYLPVQGYLMSCVRRGHPDSVLILEVLTPPMLAAYEFAAVRELLDTWIEKEPSNPTPYLYKGDLAERTRQWSEARNAYEKLVEVAPDDVRGRFRYGAFLLSRRLPQEAWPHLEWSRAHWIDTPGLDRTRAFAAVAQCLHELGRDPEARALVNELLRDAPQSAGLRTLRGLIELDSGNLQAAEEDLRYAAAIDRFEPRLLTQLERCLRLRGKDADADAVKKRIAAIDADLAAMDGFLARIRAAPHDAEARRQLAIRLMRNGLEHEARRWLESGLRHDPLHGPTYESLADYYEMTGDLDKGREFRSRARELNKKKTASDATP